jgi:hypothetical protein
MDGRSGREREPGGARGCMGLGRVKMTDISTIHAMITRLGTDIQSFDEITIR